ncbi:MAG: hypothetical protein JWM11_2226 [Planctomycetaceae bacterium]|nr:hypothetical protein [Planctomycetaceae bacterium]
MLALAQFAVRLICGMSLVLTAMPRAAVASGFFRVQMLIVMGLGVLAVLADQTAPLNSEISSWMPQVHWGLSLVLAVLGFIASVFWTLERRKGAANLLLLIALISMLALGLGIVLAQPKQWQTHWGLIFASDFSSALTLGGAMCGMLLGHSYLTSPTMSISPLFRLNEFLGWAGVARGVISAIVLCLAWSHLQDESVWTWLVLRWIAGVFGPIMVWQMVQRILAFRNTQAATGVLFVGVILTLLGELTGTLLLTATGYPL